MSTDENRGKQAVKRLERAYATGREFPNSVITLKAQTAADLLDYIQELEAQVEKSTVKIGDTVEITSRGQFVGMSGKVINIEPFAPTYPYSVEFVNSEGQRLAIAYFSRGDLKKVSDA